jgi:crotonobetainyl-CoA:carnitine CoA-transferase CaiB-like acyl-CoA transferase
VAIEGFRPGVARRLGIDFETLSARNPHLVYCSISGYGQQGERRDLTGHDLTYAAMTGLLDALSPGDPCVPGVQMVDAAASLLASMRILAALQAAEAGPQHLDVTLAQGAQALMPLILAETRNGQTGGPSLVRALRGSARNNLYRCADGRWLALTPLEEWFWQDLHTTLRSAALILPDEALTEERLREIFAQRPCENWFALLAPAGIPCAPVRNIEDAAHDIATAPGFGTSGGHSVPQLGAHTALWLREVGYPEERIALLAERQAILIGESLEPSLDQPGS